MIEPIEAKHRGMMNNLAAGLAKLFPGSVFVLLIADPSGPEGGRVNYISNGKRDDMLPVMKEFIARAEGRISGEIGHG